MAEQAPAWPILCHRCGAPLTPGEGSFYIVRIEAFADPTPPAVDETRPLEKISAEIDALVERLGELSERELMDQVHRRLTLSLCTACYRRWIENPTG